MYKGIYFVNTVSRGIKMRMLLNNWFQLKVAFFYKAKALHHTSLRLMASTFSAWICYAIAFFEKEKKILLTEKAFVALFFSYSMFEKRRGSTYDALQVIFTQKNGNRWHCLCQYIYFNLCPVHVIWTGRRMTNLVLNVCFDFFSRHEN